MINKICLTLIISLFINPFMWFSYAETPQAGGTLVIAQTSDITGFDPSITTELPTVRVLGLIYETLINVDADLNPLPNLAESWAFSSDGLTLTLHLREGVRFHSGDLMTSMDVKYTIERIQDETTRAVNRSNFADIVSIDTPDPYTVVLSLAQNNVAILSALGTQSAPIMSQTSAGLDLADPANINGTGPFKFESWDPGQQVILVANRDYWEAGLPYLDAIEVRVLPDELSIAAAMSVGEIDFAIVNDPVVVRTIEADPDLTLLKVPALAYHVLQLNSTRPPFTDQRVRQALSCTIDRQQVLDTAALGEGRVTGPNTIPRYQTPFDQLPCSTPDPIEAQRLLAEAGLSQGFEFTVITANQQPTAAAEAQNIAAQLAPLGITMNIEVMDLNTHTDRWTNADFDAAIALNGGSSDPHLAFLRYWSSEGSLNTVAAYSNPELETLLLEGRTEIDPQRRISIYQDFERQLVDAAPWIWLYVGYEYRAMQANVKGFIAVPRNSIFYLRQTYIQQ